MQVHIEACSKFFKLVDLSISLFSDNSICFMHFCYAILLNLKFLGLLGELDPLSLCYVSLYDTYF